MVCWAIAEAAVIEMACSLIMESIFGRGPSVIKTSVHQTHTHTHTNTHSHNQEGANSAPYCTCSFCIVTHYSRSNQETWAFLRPICSELLLLLLLLRLQQMFTFSIPHRFVSVHLEKHLLNGCQLLPVSENFFHSPKTGLFMIASFTNKSQWHGWRHMTLFTSCGDGSLFRAVLTPHTTAAGNRKLYQCKHNEV